MSASARPPVIVAGGSANALFIGRSLGAIGVPVYGLGVHPAAAASRFVHRIPDADDPEDEPVERWAEYLLGRASEPLHGAVVVAGSDVGITVLARHRAALLERFRLDISEVEAQLSLLNKLSTYSWATTAGVPTPRYWRVDGVEDLERQRDEYTYPVIVKPLLSHEYQARLPAWGKFRVAHDLDELREMHREVTGAGLAVMITERIPGPDTLLCSYNTYLDESGSPMFDFTKRTLRRYPPGMGLGTHHLSDHNPEVKAVALRLFKHVGLVGMANAEFKHDTRDGQLKLIECNARFTDSVALWGAAGFDMARHVYHRVLGEPYELPSDYRPGQRMVYPFNDLRAFRVLRARGELTLGRWLRDMAHPQVWPFFALDDPGPALARARSRVASFLRARTRTVRRRQNRQVGTSGTRR